MKKECRRLQKLFPLYAENAVTNTEKKSIEKHIAVCPVCASRLAQIKQTLQVIQNEQTEAEMPPYLNKKILAHITEPQTGKFSLFWKAALVSALVLVIVFLFHPFSYQSSSEVTLLSAYNVLENFSFQNQELLWSSYINDSDDTKFALYESLYFYLSENLEYVDYKTVSEYYKVLDENINYFI